jgi:hypothetical protein
METTKKITASVDEIACFIAQLIAVAYEHDGKRLNYYNLTEIHTRVSNDVEAADFKEAQKEFKELLYVYRWADEGEEKHLDKIN